MNSSGGNSLDGLISRWRKFTALPVKLVEMIPEIGGDAFTLSSVLFYHVNHDRNEEVAWPGYDRLREMIGLRYQRISDALKTLEGVKLLLRRRRFGASTIYILTHQINMTPSRLSSRQAKMPSLRTCEGQFSMRMEAKSPPGRRLT